MEFFTNRVVNPRFLLVKIRDYLKMDKFPYEKVFIDPGVGELSMMDEYGWKDWIDVGEFLDTLPDNHWFTCDYPSDMNLNLGHIFLKKSWEMAKKHCGHPQYIVTAQYPHNHALLFMKWFKKYNDLEHRSGILGLGNLCRIPTLTNYLKYILDFAFKHAADDVEQIHVYGLCLRAIPYVQELSEKYGIKVSVDSTKWCFAYNNDLKDEYGLYASTKKQQLLFFNEYCQEIVRRGVPLSW